MRDTFDLHYKHMVINIDAGPFFRNKMTIHIN